MVSCKTCKNYYCMEWDEYENSIECDYFKSYCSCKDSVLLQEIVEEGYKVNCEKYIIDSFYK